MELKAIASRLDAKWTVIILAVGALVLFTVVPMLYLVVRSFFVNETINFTNYRDVYSAAVNWRALITTFKLSLVVMILSLVLSFPLAWLVPHQYAR